MLPMISLRGKRVLIKTLEGGREHPVSEAQRRWAYAAEDRGDLEPGTAHKWSKRVEGEDLPEHTDDFKPVGKSSNGVEDESRPGSTGESEEEAEWDLQNRKPQSHAYNDEQEINVNAAKKKRGMAAKAVRDLPLHPSKKNPAVQRHQNPDKDRHNKRDMLYGSTSGRMTQQNKPYEPHKTHRKKVESVVGQGAAPSLDPSVAAGDVQVDRKNPDAPEPQFNYRYRPGPGDKPYRKSLLGEGFFVVVSLLKAIKQVHGYTRRGKQVSGYSAQYRPAYKLGWKEGRSDAEGETTIVPLHPRDFGDQLGDGSYTLRHDRARLAGYQDAFKRFSKDRTYDDVVEEMSENKELSRGRTKELRAAMKRTPEGMAKKFSNHRPALLTIAFGALENANYHDHAEMLRGTFGVKTQGVEPLFREGDRISYQQNWDGNRIARFLARMFEHAGHDKIGQWFRKDFYKVGEEQKDE